MKRKLILASLLAVMAAAGKEARAQESKWYMPPYFYDMTTAAPTPASTSTYSYSGAQSVYDNNGNLLFYVSDGVVYKADGTTTWSLPILTFAYSSLINDYYRESSFGPKIVIVPVPQVCNQYYVIYSLFNAEGAVNKVYVKVDMSSGAPVLNSASVHPASNDGYNGGQAINNPTIITGGTSGGPASDFFAVSKTINANNERYLFDLGYVYPTSSIRKLKISSTGITLVGNIYTIPATSDIVDNAAMELSPNQQYLAFTMYNSSNFYQLKLDASYNVVTSVIANIGNTITGIQYDATSTNVFVAGSHYQSPSTIGGVFWNAAASVGATSFTLITGSTAFISSSLELGKTGNIYGIANSNQKLIYFSPASLPTVPTISTTNITVSNFTNYPEGYIRCLPAQIDGEDYSYFSSYPKPVCNFDVNGTPSGNTTSQFLDVYTCSNLFVNLDNTSTGASSYSLVVQSCDASGNVLSGANYLSYSSGVHPSTSLFDLRNLPTYITMGGIQVPYTPNSWLGVPSHAGYYKVSFTVLNACGNSSDTKVIYLKLNAPPDPVNMNLQIVQAGGAACHSQTISSTCGQTGIYSVGFNLGSPGSTFATNNITSYTRKLEEVDCSTGSSLSTLYQDATPIVPVSSGALYGINLNSLTINGATGYFVNAANNVFGKCYKLTITASNLCSSASDWSYFQINPAGYWNETTKLPENDFVNIKAYPNPAKDILTFEYKSDGKSFPVISIYDVQGKLLISKQGTVDNTTYQITGSFTQNIDVKNLNAGLYFYKVNINGETFTGRVSKL